MLEIMREIAATGWSVDVPRRAASFDGYIAHATKDDEIVKVMGYTHGEVMASLKAMCSLRDYERALFERQAEPVVSPKPSHNARCPRCYGPAYQGLGAVRCERGGGCLAEREPRAEDVWRAESIPDAEPAWCFERGRGLFSRYATRELAVAAWRAHVLAEAKREAGL